MDGAAMNTPTPWIVDDQTGSWAMCETAELARRVARRYRMNDADAKDLAQIVTLILLQRVPVLRGEGCRPGWLTGTLGRQARRMLSRRRREVPLSLPGAAVPADSATPERAVLIRERDRALWCAAEELSSSKARSLVWLLAHRPELSQYELASELGMAEGSIGPLRRRSLDALRVSLRAAGYDACDF